MTRFITMVAALVIAMGSATLADDYGPHPDLRAIYHDMPIIEKGAIVDGAAVKGNDALVQTHLGKLETIYLMARRYDRWWVEDSWSPGGSRCAWFPLDKSAIIPLGREHLPAMKTFPDKYTGICDGDVQFHTQIYFTHDPAAFVDNFWLTFAFAKSDASDDTSLSAVRLRPPTEAESWMTPGGNSYFFVSADVKSAQPVHVAAGTTVDVKFPFVLPPEKKYSLTIGYTDEPVGPIDGTLKDNTLHFVLPAFSVKPGAHLMGEIDGNPPGL